MLAHILGGLNIALAAYLGATDGNLRWLLLSSLVVGSFKVASGPSYDLVIQANAEGRLGVFPRLLFWAGAISAAVAFAVALIARWIAG